MASDWVPVVSSVVSFISMIVTFYNVNRTQIKNYKNDIERFKRDLGLKAADELIDSLINLNEVIQDIAKFKTRWNLYMSNKISDFNGEICYNKPEVAELLEHVFSIDKSFWIGLEDNFQAAVKRGAKVI